MATDSIIDGTVLDQNDIPVSGALVYIYDETGDLAELRDNLGQSAPNPTVTGEDGFWQAHAETDSAYRIEYNWAGRLRLIEANRVLGRSTAELAQDARDSADISTGARRYFETVAAGVAETTAPATFTSDENGPLTWYDAAGNPLDGPIGRSLMSGTLFTAIAAAVIPAPVMAVDTAGHTAPGIGSARYIENAALDDATITAFPHTTFKDAGGRYWELAEERPTLRQAGYVHGTTTGLPITEILDELELFVSTRTKKLELERFATPIPLVTPWRPRSGNDILLRAHVTITPATAIPGENCCIRFGDFFPSYTDPTTTGGSTPTQFATGYSIGNIAQITNVVTVPGALAVALSVGDGVMVESEAAHRINNANRANYSLVTRVAGIDLGTNQITLADYIDEAIGNAKIFQGDQPDVKATAAARHGMFVLFDYTMHGDGILDGQADNAMMRSACYNTKLLGISLRGKHGVFGNLICKSNWILREVRAYEKLVDIAAASHEFDCYAEQWIFDGPGDLDAGGISAFVINEASRKVHVRGKSALLPEYTNNSVFEYRNCRQSGFDFEFVSAPNCTAAFAFEADFNGIGTEPQMYANYIRVGTAVTGTGRPLNCANDNALGFEVRGGVFVCTGTNNARIKGRNGKILPGVRFANIGLDLMAGVTGWRIASADIDGGIVEVTGKRSDNIISGGKSVSWSALRAVRQNSTTYLTRTQTAAGTPIATMAIPPGALVAGDRIRIKARVTSTGNNAAKTLELRDDTGAVVTIAIPAAAAAQSIALDFTAVVQTNVALSFVGTVTVGAVTTAYTARRTTLDLSANGRTIELDGWKTDAGDGLFIHELQMQPVREGHDALAA